VDVKPYSLTHSLTHCHGQEVKPSCTEMVRTLREGGFQLRSVRVILPTHIATHRYKRTNKQTRAHNVHTAGEERSS